MSDDDPLRPMPMSPEEVADLVERTRAAMSEQARREAHARCRRSRHAARMRRWRQSRAAKA